MANNNQYIPRYYEEWDRDLRKKLSPMFGSSIVNMNPVTVNQELGGTPQQEPVAPRRTINDYMKIQSAINKYESKQNSMPNLIRRLVGRSGSLASTGASSSADLKYIMGQTNEGIENEILNRQRSAIISGDIKNINEWAKWYQDSGFDPHFAKPARESAQSIFGQQRAERRDVESQDAARYAKERFKFAQAEARRKKQDWNEKQTDESRDLYRVSLQDEIVAYGASKWAGLAPEKRTKEERAKIERELMEHSRNQAFEGFEISGSIYTPKGRAEGMTSTPTYVNRDEGEILDAFRKEAQVILKDAEAEDEDFVTVPALTYTDQYEEQWKTAADDFETAADLGREIRAAIGADASIAQKDKQAVLEEVLSNLESVEKGVSRPTDPTDPALLRNQKMYEGMVQVAPSALPEYKDENGKLIKGVRTEEGTENVRLARDNFVRTLQIMERGQRASSEHLAQLTEPLMKDRIYREMTQMKGMHRESSDISLDNITEPNLVAMKNAISAINERLSAGKYKDGAGNTIKLTDVDRMNYQKVIIAELQKYADYWGVTRDYALWRYDPKKYRDRKVEF